MRILSLFSRGALLLAALAAEPAMAEQQGDAPPGHTSSASAKALANPLRIALVIGINYATPTGGSRAEISTGALTRPADDAQDVKMMLENAGYRVTLLIRPEETTLRAIRKQLDLALGIDNKQAVSEDSVLIYFSGHGAAVQEFAPEYDGGLRFKLLPSDFAQDALDVERDLLQRLSLSKAKNKALIIDACFNGRGKSAGGLTQLPSNLAPTTDILRQSYGSAAVLLASRWSESAWEVDDLPHSIYTHHLLEAVTKEYGDLDQNNAISAWEAHTYAQKRVIEETSPQGRYAQAQPQIPLASLQWVGGSDLYLSALPHPTAAPTKAYVVPSEGGLTPKSVTVGGELWDLNAPLRVEPGNVEVQVAIKEDPHPRKGRILMRAGERYTPQRLWELLGLSSLSVEAAGGLTTVPAEDTQALWESRQTDVALRMLAHARANRPWGLTMGFELGVSWPNTYFPLTGASARDVPTNGEPDGSSTSWIATHQRSTLHMGLEPIWRYDLHPHLKVGAGAHVKGAYTSPVEGLGALLFGDNGAAVDVSSGTQGGWLIFAGGPVLWQSIPLQGEHVQLTLRQCATVYRIPLQSDTTSKTYATLSMQTGLEFRK